MNNQQGYRFKFQDQNSWRKHLDQQGFVVIANWLSKQESQKYIDDFWGIMEILSDGALDRNKPETQVSSQSYCPLLHGGMVHYVGHSQPQWQLRKKAKPLFQKLWKQQSVKTSFDGFCFMNGNRNYQETPINDFVHTDQSPTVNKIWCYQGIQCLTTNRQNQGGFVVIPKSNNYHRKYFQDKGMLGYQRHWYKIPEQDKSNQQSIFYYKKCLKVNTQAGDFILFDSRTFHCSTVPKENVLRICTYICMLPESHISQQTKDLRKNAVQNHRVSSHNPGDGFETFPFYPKHLPVQKQPRFSQLLTKVNCVILDEQIKEIL